MGRPRQPVDLLVLKGKKHLTKSEIAERKSQEIRAPSDKVKAPRYLDKEAKREFNKLAKELVELGILTNLDVDALARFLLARRMYLAVTDELLTINPVHNVEGFDDRGQPIIRKIANENYGDLLQNQDKLFKQCRQAASDLGLTIAARAKLVIPKKEEPKPKTNPEKMFGGRV